MTVGPIFLLVFGLAIAAVWLKRNLDISKALRQTNFLSPTSFPKPPDKMPRVSVIVAARDEEDGIDRCLRTLLDQDYPNFELIAVNDRSRDGTGAILEQLRVAAGDRMKVVTIETVRPGWYGKTNAMREGVTRADGDYLLFTDADCEQLSRVTISTAVQHMQEHGVEFLSVTPVMHSQCVWESIVQPACVGVLMFWHSPERVNDPTSATAYANGAFMLFERKAYDRMGGHGSAASAICEDMELARVAKRKGVRLRVVQNRELYQTKMYSSLRETWRGWTRIMQGSLQIPRRAIIAATILFIFSVLPWIMAAITTAWAVTSSWPHGEWIAAAWLTAVAAQLSVMMRFYPLVQASRWLALTYPLGALFTTGILFHAAGKLLGFGATVWRGTAYQARCNTDPITTTNIGCESVGGSTSHVQ